MNDHKISAPGKKRAGVIILVQFLKQTVLIQRIFTSPDDNQKWSTKIASEHRQLRKRGKNKP